MGLLPRTALCLAVILVGCSGPPSPGDPTEAPGATVTPAPVPTDRSPTVRDGVGGEDLLWLAARHETALSRHSFTARGRRVVTGPAGVLAYEEWERRVATDHETYHELRSGSATWGWDGRDPVDRRHVYHTGDRTLVRYVSEEETRYETRDEPGGSGPVADLDGSEDLRRLLDAFGPWRVVRYPNGTLVIESGDLENPAGIAPTTPLSDVHDATAVMRVLPSGRVSRVAVRFRATVEGTSVAVVEIRRYVAVGETTTDRPRWYRAALGRSAPTGTGTDTGTGTPDGR